MKVELPASKRARAGRGRRKNASIYGKGKGPAVDSGRFRRFRVSARGHDDDFIWMAACILWERLRPERPSFEMLDDQRQALKPDQSPAAATALSLFADALLPEFLAVAGGRPFP